MVSKSGSTGRACALSGRMTEEVLNNSVCEKIENKKEKY